ncbi:MAG: apolipoprotein N-acyltransferase [Proteobacteria bacterium]|nr:apolipoprotein N-acyltransferase [Pseudomonadota bacterium]
MRPQAALPLALAAGALHTAAFAPTGWWWLSPLALALLAALVQRATPAQAAARGAAFGMGWFVTGLWWLYVSLHDFGGLPSLPSALAVGLLCAFQSAYVAAAMALAAWLRRGSPLPDALTFAAAWLVMELARAQWFTGFAWMASGYPHTDGPLARLAPWIGVHGIGFVVALLAAALAQAVIARRRALPALAAGLALPLIGLALPQHFTNPVGPLRISLIQPAIAQDLKFDADYLLQGLARLEAQLHAAKGDLVVTPESVLPLPREALDAERWQALTAPFGQGRAALIGLFDKGEQGLYVNTLMGVGGQSAGYAYGKRHLLPFGEFVPWGFRWFVDLLAIPLGDQGHGRETRPFVVGDQRVRPLICYEDLFGEDFADAFVGPEAATLMVNATNLAWFGPHLVQDQHLQFSRMRALEFQRAVARATNTGATALVDHEGRVTVRLAPLVVGTLEVTAQGRKGSTPYARWLAAWGLAPLWLLAGAWLLSCRRPWPYRPASRW